MPAMNEPSPIVYIVDDDEAIRDSLSMLMASVGLASLAYGSAVEFLDAYDPASYACVVADIRMPGMSGLELQQELAARGATIPLLFITGHGDVPMAVRAIQDGAVDFLQKPFRDQDLIDRIHKVLQREASDRRERLRLKSARMRLQALTPREREVMANVVAGLANKVIAMDLGVSQRTVELHRARVMQKMAVRSLAELVRLVAWIEET